MELFSEFIFEKILLANAESGMISVLAIKKLKEGEQPKTNGKAIFLISKKNLQNEDIPQLFDSRKTSVLKEIQSNDKYCQYDVIVDPTLNPLKIDTIFPASEEDIAKFSPQNKFLFRESYQDYLRITMPFLHSTPPEKKQWIYNILEHKKENDKIIAEDPDPETGFILLPDSKWDCVSINSLYALAIVNRRDLLSVRDLTLEHVPLLLNVKEKSASAITQKFGVPSNQLRIFVHYLPTFNHFHIHFSTIFGPSFAGLHAGRAILLDDIIDNINRDSKYYQQISLTFIVQENEPIGRLLKKS